MLIKKLAENVPQTNNKFSQWLGKTILQLLGWKIVGQFPQRAKFLVAVAPHTSNWDFVIAVAAMLAIQIKIRFLGKNALFFWPFKIWLNHIGGIPVERNSRHGVVEQMVALFNKNEQLVLAIAPEGTRRKTKQWKSGFLHIAHQAQIPVVPLSLDFTKKEISVHAEVFIQADIEQELVRFKDIFINITPKNPQNR
ncbi:MAG: 1-acyl-sn-glycerol-3-phosphate acyltransferase [Alteromonadaceae bacterium]|nr:1-acyl-sn-glycerol-3-phosphate acyltransferase [Alteromonadaceae bacterium]